LEPVSGIGELVTKSDLVISLCAPAVAEWVAQDVAGFARAGLVYLEANAVTPKRVERIERSLPGVVVVDGSVVGSPPRAGKAPRLYLSGPADAVESVSRLFRNTDVNVRVLGPRVGTASALKLSYSSFQKASRVLAAVAYATAEADGLGDELLDIAGLRPGSYLSETDYIPITAGRAWRWGPELEDAAAHVRDLGLPDEMIRGAARVLERWDDVHDARLELSEALGFLRNLDP
jgi:3-hydroxyisobutyrate dehydrogenase-like beta-hydroxyacid dehydrogenase